uniref:CCHC-type domain-containing protein n=1 Tax=Psilocybe cubensis TaxID=181762 RepID=A0A8H7XIV1_PSICU
MQGTRCYNCKKEGHLARECPLPKENRVHLRAAHTAVSEDDEKGSDRDDNTPEQEPTDKQNSGDEDAYTEVEVMNSDRYKEYSSDNEDNMYAMRIIGLDEDTHHDGTQIPQVGHDTMIKDNDSGLETTDEAFPDLYSVPASNDEGECAQYNTAMTETPERSAKNYDEARMRKV